MSKEQTCCVTGHRDIPFEKIPYVQDQLRQELVQAIQHGYTHFISGFASGVDLIFSGIVASLKREYPITLEAAIPYPARMSTPDVDFQRLIKSCDVVKVHSTHFFNGCYAVRNRYMVVNSTLVIAVYDGRQTGGTATTVKFACRNGCEVWEIKL